MSVVTLKSIKKSFGTTQTVHGIDLDIADGEFIVLVGPSGCGKSTTLRMIAGLESITEGDLLIDGRKVNELEPGDRDVAMVFQNYALYPHLNVADNITFGLRLRKVPKPEVAERLDHTAAILGLQPYLYRKPRQLSGGQRQRVAMGRAIIRNPSVFLFDEPLSNLDAELRSQMRAEIKHLHAKLPTTTIYVTHDQVEAMTLADRVVVMNDGRIEQIADPETLYLHPDSRFVAGFIGSPGMNFFDATVEPSGDGARLRFRDGQTLEVAARAPFSTNAGRDLVVGIRPEHVSLNDAEAADALHAEITLVEPLGMETLVHLRLGDAEMLARIEPQRGLKAGQQVPVAVNPDKLHLFDRETGAAIVR
ncbi:sn-glycerol-3-phosphate ABC transporter ATP-binding protein UgpC [Psychromarinibacter sp. C21-152]|uniref:Sn-glycerol-3-phosphate ABC transporter ATP-binding protein UgpC n=1 Tax=Psychromarinibacter sediminicola TaxID=3033385 RepID=A0AAE3T6M9_9RHOB|nr:sn-glycerol-3-phosphate ABC transporter ATP-binding protein UgpC [Psychromarinibacter sediminicola]MDF0599465.1 sn-glycerol-3-phosphate ABC transporter ATP-binding protein UgpC [Psychromarinibacter sediminicola]